MIAGWEIGLRDGWAVWSTYRLSDFLMFSPQTYLRLFELAHAEGWPWAQMAAALLGLTLLGCTLPRSQPAGRPWLLVLGCLVLGAAWIVAGVGFVGRHFASIHWAGPGLAMTFVLQGALLLALAMAWGLASISAPAHPPAHTPAHTPAPASELAPEPEPVSAPTPSGHARATSSEDAPGKLGRARIVSMALVVGGVAAYPLLAPLLQRPWQQAEVFALMPDPTVLATLGLLPMLRSAAVRRPAGARWRNLPALLGGLAWPIPLAVAMLQGATLWTMGWSALAMLLPGAALLACWAARR